MRSLVVLGSTGSIGTQALDVIRRNDDDFTVVALAAGGADVAALASQAAEFNVTAVAIADPSREAALREALAAYGSQARVYVGPDAAAEVIAACLAAGAGEAMHRAAAPLWRDAGRPDRAIAQLAQVLPTPRGEVRCHRLIVLKEAHLLRAMRPEVARPQGADYLADGGDAPHGRSQPPQE